jgi:hypothetical protein
MDTIGTLRICMLLIWREKATFPCDPSFCLSKSATLWLLWGHLKPATLKGIDMWLRNDPECTVNHYQIAKLTRMAYLRAASAETALNCFRKTGTFPMNKNVFREIISLFRNRNHHCWGWIFQNLKIKQTGLLSRHHHFFTHHASVCSYISQQGRINFKKIMVSNKTSYERFLL